MYIFVGTLVVLCVLIYYTMQPKLITRYEDGEQVFYHVIDGKEVPFK